MILLVFVVGLALGVVVNALADDLPPDELGMTRGLAKPRCRYCGAEHAPYLWPALASLFLRRGACEHCGAPRSWRHMLVEAVTGLCLAGVWSWAGGRWAAFAPAALLVFVFTLIAVIDIEHRLILWRVVVPAALAVAVAQGLTRGWVPTLEGGLAGYGIVFGMFLFGQLFSMTVAQMHGRPLDEIAFGGGDVNLAALAGLAVGWPGVLLMVLATVVSGGVFALAFIVVQKVRGRYNPYTAFPYGPFFILGAAAVYLYGHAFGLWYTGYLASRR
jgi:leader peptidase (prepilin peptidase)/N-methyltransferase